MSSLIPCKTIACGLLIAGLTLHSYAVPAYAEDWNNNSKIVKSGLVKVGGTDENRYEVILNKSYDNIFFGNADNTSDECKQTESPYAYNEAECNYNTGILAAGGSGTVIIGGSAHSIMLPLASCNAIIMQSGSTLTAGSNGQKYGGYRTDSDSDGGCVYGGYATSAHAMARAGCNTVIFKKGSSVKSEKYSSHFAIHGGAVYSLENPTAYLNKVIFEKGVNLPDDGSEVDIIGGLAIAGKSGGNVSENSIRVNSGTFYSLVGGFAQGYYLTAKKNHAVLTDVNAKEFQGCLLYLQKYGDDVIASNNEFTIKNGDFERILTGCAIKVVDNYSIPSRKSEQNKTYTVKAENNKLTLIDVNVQNSVKGVSFDEFETLPSKMTDITISNNVLTLKGGKYKYNVYGYYTRNYTNSSSRENSKLHIEHNTVALWKGSTMPEFSDTTVIFCYDLDPTMESDDIFSTTDNTLEFHEVWGMTAGNIRNFTNIAFDLPDMKADSAVMTLTQYITNISNTHLDVKVGNLTGADGREFKIGEKIFLLKNSKGIEAEGITVNLMPGPQGYLLDIQTDETSLYLTRIR